MAGGGQVAEILHRIESAFTGVIGHPPAPDRINRTPRRVFPAEDGVEIEALHIEIVIGD